MAKKKKNSSPIEKLSVEIEKIQNKNARITFFVFDTKGMPNGELEYIYEMAITLKNSGYNVRMLHTENEFVGVQNWLGEECAFGLRLAQRQAKPHFLRRHPGHASIYLPFPDLRNSGNLLQQQLYVAQLLDDLLLPKHKGQHSYQICYSYHLL